MAKAAKSASSDMIPAWVIRWFWITTLIVSWDASYALLHPWSRDVTDPISSVIYAPYQQTYQFVDLFYGSDAAFAKAGLGINAFGPTQSVMNIFEIIMGVVFLYLASINHGAARPLGLVTATMTCSKTIIYFIVVTFYGWTKVVPLSACRTTTETIDFLRLFLIPNGTWIVVPALCVLSLGASLSKTVTKKLA